MTKIILHVGLEKTGTTTIQRVFNASRDLLLRKGVYYPGYYGEENHVCLYNYAKSKESIDELRIYSGIKSQADVEKFRVSFKDMFIKDISERKPEYLVLSNEHLSSRLSGDEGVGRLKDLLSLVSSDISVVIYVRNIADFLVSSYSTAVKCGETRSLGEYISGQSDMPFRFKLSEVIKLWRRVFGSNNVILKEFSKESLYEKDIVSDFIKTNNLPIDKNDLSVANSSENKSLGRQGIELLRRLNEHLPLIKDGAYNPDRGNIVDVIQKLEEYQPVLLSDGDKALIEEVLSNESSRLFSELQGYEFSRNIALENAKCLKSESNEEETYVDSLIASLWVSLRQKKN